MLFDEKTIKDLADEIRAEQAISPKIQDKTFVNYISSGMYHINEIVGARINYNHDLNARALLKNYVLYARYKRQAEFEEIYEKEYAALQIKYNRDSNL